MLVPLPSSGVVRAGSRRSSGALVDEGGRVEREAVPAGLDAPFSVQSPSKGSRGAFQHVRPDFPDASARLAVKYTYHLPSMKWISGAQMCAPMGPDACLRQMTLVCADPARSGRGPAHLDAIALGGGGREVVVAVGMYEDMRVGPMAQQRIVELESAAELAPQAANITQVSSSFRMRRFLPCQGKAGPAKLVIER